MEEGSWKWEQTGVAIQPMFWSQGQPDDWNSVEDCLSVGTSEFGQEAAGGRLRWSDEVCSAENPFICRAAVEQGPCPAQTCADVSTKIRLGGIDPRIGN